MIINYKIKMSKLFTFFTLVMCLSWTNHLMAADYIKPEENGDQSVDLGKSLTITLQSSDYNTIYRGTVSSYQWRSENTSIFTVTSSNKVQATIKGVKAGKAKLYYDCTYRINNYQFTMKRYYNITVTQNVITISPHSLILNEGDTYKISATQTSVIGGSYFTSSNESVATVTLGEQDGYNSKTIVGTITAVSEGTAYIYAKTLGKETEDVCTLTVKKGGPTSIYIEKASLDMEVGDEWMLKARVNGSGGTYTWSSSNTDVATVTGSGLTAMVKAVGVGSATVYVNTSNGLQSKCWIYVKEKTVAPTHLSLTGPTELREGETMDLVATVEPSNATYTLTWSSDAADVASVDNQGKVTALSEGETVIRVKTDNGLKASLSLKVIPFVLLGDINQDKELSVADVTMLVNAIVNNEDTETIFDRGDLNSDQALSVTDVIELVKLIVNH